MASDNKLRARVISAVLAALSAVAIGIFGGVNGMYFLCAIAIVAGVFEFARMTFTRGRLPRAIAFVYVGLAALFFAGAVWRADLAPLWLALTAIAFFSTTLWLSRERVANADLLTALSVGAFGLFYAVYFPWFCVRLVGLPDGPKWFLFLLLLVFAGDTFAYFGGRFWGRRKLMPRVSPNKTWAGAIAGLIGSMLIGTLDLSLTGPDVSHIKTLSFCLVCGFVAQCGDLLVSLVKRVADVKDSGQLMPGHGGMLDRMDGIFIACPLVYAFATHVA